MCGIFAYFGDNAAENVYNGLTHLSYRGYDSWGIYLNNNVYTSLGKIEDENIPFKNESGLAIGHTRWATHGNVSLGNTQPFYSGDLVLVHNGMIDIGRYKDFSDTRMLFLKLIDMYGIGHPSILEYLDTLGGNNLFLLKIKNELYAVANGNKQLFQYKNIISSDLSILDKNQIHDIYVIQNSIKKIDLIGDYKVPKLIIKSNMYKEIEEASKINNFPNKAKMFNNKQKVMFGCGSSYNAALFLSYVRADINACYASVLHHLTHKFPNNSEYIAVSQSGDTQDIIDMTDMLLTQGKKVSGYVNKEDSILSKIVECQFMDAGPEFGVAATKTFMKTIADYMLEDVGTTNFNDLSEEIKDFVEKNNFQNYIFLGEDEYYPLALEGELKLKEVAQVWTDAMPASEIKHGPIACVSKNTLVVIVARKISPQLLSNIEQVKARGAKVISFIESPATDFSFFSESALKSNIIGCQLLAYWTAIKLGLNPDKPKNLAKVITV